MACNAVGVSNALIAVHDNFHSLQKERTPPFFGCIASHRITVIICFVPAHVENNNFSAEWKDMKC